MAKIRLFFISNSSSSSFICELCGENYTSMDASLSDAEMSQCVNGHTICNEHKLRDLTEEEESDDEMRYGAELPEDTCPICQFQNLSMPGIIPYLVKEYGVTEAEVFAVIKTINKRRKKLYPAEYVKHVFDKFDLTEDMILGILKEKYKTYSDFKKEFRRY